MDDVPILSYSESLVMVFGECGIVTDLQTREMENA